MEDVHSPTANINNEILLLLELIIDMLHISSLLLLSTK